jgi:hypothetical protein
MSQIQEIQAQNGDSIYTGAYAEFSNLNQLEAGYGYWVKGKIGDIFDEGKGRYGIVKPLKRKGWNLMAVCEDIASDDINMSRIEEIQNQLGRTIYTGEFSRYSDLTKLLNGYGHWVKGDRGAFFTSKYGLSLPLGYKYRVIDNSGVLVEGHYENYRVELYTDYPENNNSQQSHIGIFVTVKGIDIDAPLHIQESYVGHKIVVALYNQENRLEGVTEPILLNGNRIIDVTPIEGITQPIDDNGTSENNTTTGDNNTSAGDNNSTDNNNTGTGDNNSTGENNTSTGDNNNTGDTNTTIGDIPPLAQPLSFEDYALAQLDDTAFNALSYQNQLIVADKLLSSLYFGMPYLDLKALINSGKFISTVRGNLDKSLNDVAKIENYIVDKDYFHLPIHNETNEVPLVNSNAIVQHRLFAYEHLDKNFFEHWMTYVLTQTIMFSPASELSSSTLDTVMPVYNGIYENIKKDASIRHLTYEHISSLYNWRRFRSSEDNGREMIEIFLFDREDSHVPPTAKALQNWKLNDKRELIIGANENTDPIPMFNKIIYNGYDFYQALVMSDKFMEGVIRRICNIYFSTFTASKRNLMVSKILASHPENFKDIFVQILFSKEYLYNTDRVKNIDELFYSMAKKIHFAHDTHTFETLNRTRVDMHQSLMTYKLGMPVSVPMDASSFGVYREFIYKEMMLKIKVDVTDYGWGKNGWVEAELLDESLYEGVAVDDLEKRSEKFLNYLFLSTVTREISPSEWELFYGRIEAKNSWFGAGGDGSAQIVLDYLSRLVELFQYQKVQ